MVAAVAVEAVTLVNIPFHLLIVHHLVIIVLDKVDIVRVDMLDSLIQHRIGTLKVQVSFSAWSFCIANMSKVNYYQRSDLRVQYINL